ncbi:hypothetical protein, partial [Microcoleus sp. PH2017_10_PVI_O_A]|uniref:hypothetical protein n=1 Tax=Microcoleus sp. PH2017_10_PVI_O_A TaxID=2798821 RepID=UPI0025F4541D
CLNTSQPPKNFCQKPSFFSQQLSETGFLPKYLATTQKFFVRNPVSFPSNYQKPGFCLNTSQPHKNFLSETQFLFPATPK